MKITFFAGSLRKDSFNKKLVRYAQKVLVESHQVEATYVDLKDLSLPVYDGDIEAAGVPEGVKTLGAHIASAQALVISTPEYNGSIAGSFKNTIDWVSRLKPMPWAGKPLFLMGATPGAMATVRSLGISRLPLDLLGAYVYPQMFGLPKASEAFSPTGDLTDEPTRARLSKLLGEFYIFAEKLKSSAP